MYVYDSPIPLRLLQAYPYMPAYGGYPVNNYMMARGPAMRGGPYPNAQVPCICSRPCDIYFTLYPL